jgi:endonuclease G
MPKSIRQLSSRIRLTLFITVLCLAVTALLAHGFFTRRAQAISNTIVISQVYSGGGASTGSPTYKFDYVELFNLSPSTVSLTGYSLQYGSATGNFGGSGNIFSFPSGTSIPAGKYLLVKLGSAGSLGADFTADLTSGGLSMAQGSGKVALATTVSTLGCGATATPCALPNAQIIDLVSWGASNNAEGGTTVNNGTAFPNTSVGAVRKLSGCQDTDNNNNDFNVVSGPVPRTSSSPANNCTPTNNSPTITPPASPIATKNQDDPPFTVSLTGNDDGGVYSWSATPGTGITSVSVTGGQGTPNVTYTVTLQSGFNGTAKFTASLSDLVNPAATQLVNIAVNAPVIVDNPPTITPPANPIATVTRDEVPFTVGLSGSDDHNSYGWAAIPGTGVSSVVVTGGQGTASVTYTVALQAGFTGTATFTASLSDNVNPAASQLVNITVNPPTPLNHITISQIYGGGGNSGATYRNDYVELYNPTNGPVDLGGWTIQYASATGTTWQAQPLGGIMQPGEYYLISLASGGAVGAFLPAANIDGSINMSATSGKVALSNGGDALSDCPTSDPTLVDLVGYGTAECKEGGATAPQGNNTTAIFRKNGGATDTNSNSLDFLTGPPNPRRTTPIVEIGPYVLSVDPRANSTTGPYDASITVNFTEPVDVDTSWYNINCANTNSHNDATVAHTSDFKTYVITPNTSFQFSEQCTVTVLKTRIHDRDFDDSAADTDTLKADYIWSFTVVAANVLPLPYPSSVHLTMGNPSNALADTNFPNNYLMEKPTYSLSYNRDKGTPNWVSWHLDPSWYGSLARVDTFRPDPAVPSDWYRVQAFDFFLTGFDRGHMTPNADRDHESRIPINQETYLMSNMVPQAPDNNQGPWANMENALRSITNAGNEIYVVSGPQGVGGTSSNGFTTSIANGKVTVPANTWKVALVLSQGTNDISRVNCSTRTIAVIMPNVQGIRTTNSNDWMNYLTTVDAVEALTTYDFFSSLPEPIQRCIEKGVNGVGNGLLDTDADGVPDATDNCDFTQNVGQQDFDQDGIGDACDSDDDNDNTSDTDEAACGSNPLNAASTCEVCDGADNDLDSAVDEGFTNTDGDSQADCVDADDDNDNISDVDEAACGSNPLSSASTCEVCDGADNDLDSAVDEGFPNTDGDGQADCVDADDDNDGTLDTAEGACGSNPLNAASTCEVCDGADNDLDSAVDEGFPSTDGDGQADCVDADDDNDNISDVDEAACGSNPLNAASTCEVCDGADNDLDGSVDEGFPNTDGDGQADCVDADDDNDNISDADELACGSNPLNAASTCEACDGVDNDLDGTIDEGFPNTDGDGQADCVDADDDNDNISDVDEAACGSNPLNSASTCEVCDGADNDLDSAVDEGFPNTDGDGQADCVDADDDNDGTLDTAEGACGSNPLNANSRCEICDGIDNDLDGMTDEGFADTDNDGQADCVDPDDDNDTVIDAIDNCPFVANTNQADADQDGFGDACDAQIGPPTKDQCKNGGWQFFNYPRRFNNQGDCIQFVNTGK